MPEAEPAPTGQGEHRGGSPAAVADFAGLGADDTGAASVASFDDLDEAAGTPYVRPDLLGRETTDDDLDDAPGRDTHEAQSSGAAGKRFTEASAEVGASDGPATVRTVSLDDLSGVDGAVDGGNEDDGAPDVRVASFDGRRPPSGRSTRPRSERSRTSTRRRAAPAGEATAAPEPDGDGSGVAEPDTGESSDARPRRGRGTRSGGASRGGRGGGGSLSFSPQDDEARAKEICLRLLADRARTVQELSQALRRKEIPDEVAQRVLERFDEVGLVDDEAFAGQWVRSRHKQRGLGRRAIAAELHRKGVAKEIADEALTEIDAESEEARARELVDRKLRTVPIATKEQRVTAARRLVGMLARKGYGGNIAYGVVREAIAARGAEEDELGEGPFED